MYLPVATGPATQWVLYDYGRCFRDSAPAANGQAIAQIATVPQDELWMIDLVRVKTDDSDLTSTAFVCLDTPDFDVSGTATGAYDVADQAAPIHAPGGSVVLVVWRNITAGLVGNAYVQWTVLKTNQGA
jgi:hypothetical protein